MAGRIRSIKPEILDDEEVCGLSDEAWRLWVSTWLLADDNGNSRAGDRYLAALVWQDTHRAPRVADILRELRRARRVDIYENNGERYLHIRNWEKHQRIDNAGKPRVPSSDDAKSVPWDESRGEPPRLAENRSDSRLDQRPRPTTNDPDLSIPDSPPASREEFDFEAVYALYPRKEGRKKGLTRCRSSVKTRLKYDALMQAVKNYAASVTDVQYAKHFDTFVGCWEDYVDAKVLTPITPRREDKPYTGPKPPIAALVVGGKEPL